jgi:hypothetical protein
MQTITTSFRAGEMDLRRWRKAAADAGLSWNEWIRSALLEREERAVMAGSVAERELVGEPEAAPPEGEEF